MTAVTVSIHDHFYCSFSLVVDMFFTDFINMIHLTGDGDNHYPSSLWQKWLQVTAIFVSSESCLKFFRCNYFLHVGAGPKNFQSIRV